MRPITADVLAISIPFRFTFRHALAARSQSDGILVRLEDSEGNVGFGECAPRDYVSGETCETAKESLRAKLALFVGRKFESFAAARHALEDAARGLLREEHAAFCALEMAVLDLAGKAFAVSAGSVLGPVVHRQIHYSGIVSADDVEPALEACVALQRVAIRAVKVKVGQSQETDVAILRGAREVLGPECSLRVDANCAWDKETALRRLAAFEPFRLAGIEQPLVASDHAGLAWLTARSSVPVIADESLVSVEDATRLAENRACNVFNIRVSKCGGLIGSARIREIGLRAGIDCMLGAQVGETALLSAAGRHFGTRCDGVRFFEGSYGTFLLEEDIGVEDLTIGKEGAAPALEGPGLGVEVDEARLAKYVTWRERFCGT